MTPLFFAALLVAQAGLGPLIDHAVPGANINYLVVDVHTRQMIASRWPDADTPIPLGSLVKPFTALAYNENFPELECSGSAGHCWLSKGHGRLKFTEALAQSCNAYFLQLAGFVSPEALRFVTTRYGIAAPAEDSPDARIGLGANWKIAPLSMARAYAELAARGGEPRVAEILRGLAGSASHGTSSAIGSGSLAKTGTAPCTERLGHAGDGYTMVLDPADSPRIALLVRVHNVPGAVAAQTASHILQLVRSGR